LCAVLGYWAREREGPELADCVEEVGVAAGLKS
jgi:hypothetical protein